jgi:hypothetical protein
MHITGNKDSVEKICRGNTLLKERVSVDNTMTHISVGKWAKLKVILRINCHTGTRRLI